METSIVWSAKGRLVYKWRVCKPWQTNLSLGGQQQVPQTIQFGYSSRRSQPVLLFLGRLPWVQAFDTQPLDGYSTRLLAQSIGQACTTTWTHAVALVLHYWAITKWRTRSTAYLWVARWGNTPLDRMVTERRISKLRLGRIRHEHTWTRLYKLYKNMY